MTSETLRVGAQKYIVVAARKTNQDYGRQLGEAGLNVTTIAAGGCIPAPGIESLT